MIREIAWNTFKNTGNINTFLEYKKVDEIEEYIRMKEHEINQNKRNNNSRESYSRF